MKDLVNTIRGNRIVYATFREKKLSDGQKVLIRSGNETDLTERAIRCVFDWLINMIEEQHIEAYEIRYKSAKGYKLRMEKESEK